MHWLSQLIDDDCTPDAAAVAHVRRGLRTWLNSGTKSRSFYGGKSRRARPLSLARCLGLPESPERARFFQRDYYLRRAALMLSAPENRPWMRAVALHSEVNRFMGHQWACWCNLAEAPPGASDVNHLLFLAIRAGGGKLPKTTRSYSSILNS